MGLHFFGGPGDLFFQLPGGHTKHAASQGAELHQGIGGGYPHLVVSANLPDKGLDVGIRRLVFLGVDHLQIVKMPLFSRISLSCVSLRCDLSRISRDFVAVKYHHRPALGVAGVATEPVQKLPPGGVQVGFCSLGQNLPGENHVVAVHNQAPLLGRADVLPP